MALREALVFVKLSLDYESGNASVLIEYPEEGFDVILKAEESNLDLAELFPAVFDMCRKVNSAKGEMTPLKVRLSLNSERLKDDFNTIRQSARMTESVGAIHLENEVIENLSVSIPPLFAPMLQINSDAQPELAFEKFRRQKQMVN